MSDIRSKIKRIVMKHATFKYVPYCSTWVSYDDEFPNNVTDDIMEVLNERDN